MTKLSAHLKTAEAAEILGVSQTTLRKWADAGTIPQQRNSANGYFDGRICRPSSTRLPSR